MASDRAAAAGAGEYGSTSQDRHAAGDNALRYLVRAGCDWRMLPNDFPPWETVYYWFRRPMRGLLFKTIHDLALMLERMMAERQARPSAAIVGCKGYIPVEFLKYH